MQTANGDTVIETMKSHEAQATANNINALYRKFDVDGRSVTESLHSVGFHVGDIATFVSGLCIGIDIERKRRRRA